MRKQLPPNLENFGETFLHYLNKLGFEDYQTANILDIGCGQCHEANSILAITRGVLIGIDTENPKIYDLNATYADNAQAQFIAENVKNLDQITQQMFDIIIARHINPFQLTHKELKPCYKHTKDEGVIIATTYLNKEQPIVERNLRMAGYKIEISEKNPLSLNYIDSGLFKSGWDGYVIIGSKKKHQYSLMQRISDTLINHFEQIQK